MPAMDVNAQRAKLFQTQRDQAERQVNANAQQQNDVISRRMAAIGQGSGSGAAMGLQRQAANDAIQQKQQAFDTVNANETAANLQAAEAQAGRDFQSREAQLGRDFAAKESLAGRNFSADESRLGREFQGGLAAKDEAMKREFFGVEQGNTQKQIQLAREQFELDKDTTAFNRRMAEIESQKEDPGLLGQGGFLGTGLDPKAGGLGGAVARGVSAGALNPILALPAAVGLPVPDIKIPGIGGGGCFLTTAATIAMGMADDCWVLEEARRFRDTYMASDSERSKEILEYYEIAPMVVEKLNMLPESKRVWKQVFWHNIIPFVLAVKDNDMVVAHELYKKLILIAKSRAGVGVIHG